MNDYLAKPVRIDALRAMLARHLATMSAERSIDAAPGDFATEQMTWSEA